jgi:hypothetical protein
VLREVSSGDLRDQDAISEPFSFYHVNEHLCSLRVSPVAFSLAGQHEDHRERHHTSINRAREEESRS